MSALVGVLVACGVVAAAGTRGRSVGAHAREPAIARPVRPQAASDLSAVLIGVCAQLRAGAAPADAWSRAFGARAAGPVPTLDALLAVTKRHGAGRARARREHPKLDGRRRPGGLAALRGLSAHGDDRAVQRARAVQAAAELSDELGAPLAGVLERIASAVAADEEADGERRAALAGPRSTAQVLAWLPVLGVALGAFLGADPVETMLAGGLGTLSAALGVVLLLLGRWWTAALLARAGRVGDGRARAPRRSAPAGSIASRRSALPGVLATPETEVLRAVRRAGVTRSEALGVREAGAGTTGARP